MLMVHICINFDTISLSGRVAYAKWSILSASLPPSLYRSLSRSAMIALPLYFVDILTCQCCHFGKNNITKDRPSLQGTKEEQLNCYHVKVAYCANIPDMAPSVLEKQPLTTSSRHFCSFLQFGGH